MRVYLPFKERKNRRALDSAFLSVKKQALRYEREGYKSSLAVFNVALYQLIIEKDVQSLKIEALTHPDVWKRKLSLRMILLIMHEWNLDKVAGQNFRKALKDVNISKELQYEIFSSLKMIRKVQEKAWKKLAPQRNATIAHRDPDALTQIRIIDELNEKEIILLLAEFYKASKSFTSLVPKIMIESGTIPSLMKQLINRS